MDSQKFTRTLLIVGALIEVAILFSFNLLQMICSASSLLVGWLISNFTLKPSPIDRTKGLHFTRRRYSSMKKIQIGEWKYNTDHNLSHSAQLIRAKYTPLTNAIRSHWPGTEVDNSTSSPSS
jgi:hypothetical protein